MILISDSAGFTEFRFVGDVFTDSPFSDATAHSPVYGVFSTPGKRCFDQVLVMEEEMLAWRAFPFEWSRTVLATDAVSECWELPELDGNSGDCRSVISRNSCWPSASSNNEVGMRTPPSTLSVIVVLGAFRVGSFFFEKSIPCVMCSSSAIIARWASSMAF